MTTVLDSFASKQKTLTLPGGYLAVSYTHLDVYKRQQQGVTPKYLPLKPNILQKHKALFDFVPL